MKRVIFLVALLSLGLTKSVKPSNDIYLDYKDKVIFVTNTIEKCDDIFDELTLILDQCTTELQLSYVTYYGVLIDLLDILTRDPELITKILDKATSELPIILSAKSDFLTAYIDPKDGTLILNYVGDGFQRGQRASVITTEFTLKKGTNINNIASILKKSNLLKDFTLITHSNSLIQIFTPNPVKARITKNLWEHIHIFIVFDSATRKVVIILEHKYASGVKPPHITEFKFGDPAIRELAVTYTHKLRNYIESRI